jgi:hypothetical protein
MKQENWLANVFKEPQKQLRIPLERATCLQKTRASKEDMLEGKAGENDEGRYWRKC